MEFIKNTMLPQERSIKAVKRWEKKLDIKLTVEEKEELIKSIVYELQSAIMEDRDNNDKFIELSKREDGILTYYLSMLDKLKYGIGDIILENSRKIRDQKLLEMAKIVGANVVEEEIPYKTKIKDIKEAI